MLPCRLGHRPWLRLTAPSCNRQFNLAPYIDLLELSAGEDANIVGSLAETMGATS